MKRRDVLPLLGAAAALPFAARAQQKAMPVVGYISLVGPEPSAQNPGPFAQNRAAFLQGLSETGFVEGRNVAIEYRYAHDRIDRVPELVADLVARKVDVIFSGPIVVIFAAKAATATIPIVFIGGP